MQLLLNVPGISYSHAPNSSHPGCSYSEPSSSSGLFPPQLLLLLLLITSHQAPTNPTPAAAPAHTLTSPQAPDCSHPSCCSCYYSHPSCCSCYYSHLSSSSGLLPPQLLLLLIFLAILKLRTAPTPAAAPAHILSHPQAPDCSDPSCCSCSFSHLSSSS
jgi:hypothetical protein